MSRRRVDGGHDAVGRAIVATTKAAILAMACAAFWVASGVAITPAQAQSKTEVAMERVQGIGELFFRAKDPKAMAIWYETHLGVTQVPDSYDKDRKSVV